MLYQDDDTELYGEWLTDNGRLTHFRKSRDRIVVRFKVEESTSVQGPQYYEEDLVVRERALSRTCRPSVIEPITYENHAPVGQSQNNGYSDNSQVIPVSMENRHPEATEYQYVTSPSV